MNKSESHRRAISVVKTLPAILWALAILVPISFLVIISLRTRAQYAANPLALPETPSLNNFATAWLKADLGSAFLNTLIVTVVAIAGVVFFASLAAYAIVRWTGRSGNRIYIYFIVGLIVPFQLGLPTLYKIWAQAGLVDSLGGVILIHIGAGLPLAIFLYSGFMRTVPIELEESARIDGAGDIRIYRSIVFPLLRPVTATVIILTGISVWNDLLVSLYFLQSSGAKTLPKATMAFLSAYSSDMPVIFACAILSVIPVIVLFVGLQRFFMSGLTMGALRG